MPNLKEGDRVRLMGTGGLLDTQEGKIVEVKDDEAHVLLDPSKEARWCGGREWWIEIGRLRKVAKQH